MSTPFLREQARLRTQSNLLRRDDDDWASNGGVANYQNGDDDDDNDINNAFGNRNRRRNDNNAAVVHHHQSSSSLFYSSIPPQQLQHTPEQQQQLQQQQHYQQQHHHHYPQQQQQHYPQHQAAHQQQQQHGYCTTSNNNISNDRNYNINSNDAVDNDDLAASARKTWRHHGTGVTQALEEQRQQCGFMTVSIVAAVERVDVAMQEYTAYVIRVEMEENEQEQDDDDEDDEHVQQRGSTSRISKPQRRRPHRKEVFTEHRYSEFAKLHQFIVASLQSSTNSSYSKFLTEMPPFPKRSPFGRVGNWTPSQMFAPRQHDELIRYRQVQLDAWLVYIFAAAAARNKELNSVCQAAIYDFILQPTPLPCHRSTTVAMTTTATLDANNNNSIMSSSPHHVNNNTASIGNSYYPSPPPSMPLQAFWQWNNPFSFTLGAGIRQACRTVQLMCGLSSTSDIHTSSNTRNILPSTSRTLQESDQSIPIDLLRAARGLMFMTVVKGGLVISGRFGTGLVIARRSGDNNNNISNSEQQCEWSAPCAVGTLGLGWGALAGADVTHFLVVLTTDQAVADLVSGGKTASSSGSSTSRSAASTLSNSVVQLGAELSVAVGPIGRGANSHLQTGDWTLHPAYAYAHSHGLFVGISIEGSVITVRHDVNAKFYGRSDFAGHHGINGINGSNHSCNSNYARTEILQNMPPPKAAESLYQVLHQAMQVEIRKGSFRPSQLLWSQAGGGNNYSDDNIYNLNSPATQSYHQGSGSSGSSGNPTNYTHTTTTRLTNAGGAGNDRSNGTETGKRNKSRRQQQQLPQQPQPHQYLHPHHHEQFLYPKENHHQQFYHQKPLEKDINKSRPPAGAATTTSTFPSGSGVGGGYTY
jgi:lipid-binding SYLF domain-containing protein